VLRLSVYYLYQNLWVGKTNTVIGTPIPVDGLSIRPSGGDKQQGIAFDSANGNLYVTNYGNNTVSVISGKTNTVIGTPIPVGRDDVGPELAAEL
jgi:YVTN family beta-propeller protein